MRINIKDEKYFNQYIETHTDDIDYFEEGIRVGRTNPDRVASVQRKIFTTSLHLLIAKYASGYQLDKLKNEFLSVIEKFEKGWKDKGDTPTDNIHFDNYVLVLWMLSLGILLNLEIENYQRIVTVLDNSKRRDYLLEYIIQAKISNRTIFNDLTYPKHFGFFKKLIENKDITTLKNHLEKDWYNSMKLTYWYDNHKSKANTFFGYWSFESGALVKILNLDDSILKDQQYYPYDMVHFK
ncbi:PoNi-like cognate immunity protein [Neisseria montereyensis]|uniref:PoNi-like cognate immunity protein n=1 Tax=Neisseria montereyensis TaxID=2973938 RepID=A0ABT2F9Y5_9NEIS|nr:PoNi-like cognate immunity protein [Neisseria montereyensis]MCS4533014.1 PoNi-like cognate immunity protein [Neisseria montereyensis]